MEGIDEMQKGQKGQRIEKKNAILQ